MLLNSDLKSEVIYKMETHNSSSCYNTGFHFFANHSYIACNFFPGDYCWFGFVLGVGLVLG